MTPRADAERNRARVLAAAEEVFAARGTAASTDQVARTAGVGVGTVFRHFPTKQALLSAVLADRLDRLAAEAVRRCAEPDPGAALFGLVERVVEQARSKSAYTDALAAAGVDAREAVGDASERVRRAMGALLDRAQATGAVRADVTVPQLFALLVGAAHAAEHTGWDPDLSAGTLRVLLDGLRPRP